MHRPKYDDWSLPKGKVDPGEHVVAAAVREVAEETGHTVVLGRPLTPQQYRVNGALKEVSYWTARADDSAAPWRGTKEIDQVDFVPAKRARRRLTHPRDAALVAEAVEQLDDPPLGTSPLVILRHGKAQSRSRWDGPDGERPLEPKGSVQAERLVELLRCFGIERVVTSDALRCVDTVRPYASSVGALIELEPRVSEKACRDNPSGSRAVVLSLAADARPVVLCSHRPVLPELSAATQALTAKQVRLGKDALAALSPGAFVVLHRQADRIVAWEQHES